MTKDRALDELYRLAGNCAEFNHKGCNCQCGQCGYNVYLYTNERDATLIKSNAYANYRRHIELKKEIKDFEFGERLGLWIGLLIIVGLIMWGCS